MTQRLIKRSREEEYEEAKSYSRRGRTFIICEWYTRGGRCPYVLQYLFTFAVVLY